MENSTELFLLVFNSSGQAVMDDIGFPLESFEISGNIFLAAGFEDR